MSKMRTCIKCEKEKRETEFYVSYSPLHNGKVPVCKSCIRKLINYDDLNSIKDTLRMIDRPFLQFLWDSSVEEGKETGTDIFGKYMKNLGMKQYRDYTWADSIFNTKDSPEQIMSETNNNQHYNDQYKISETELERLREIYGHGFPDNEYLLFEKKFQQLKPSFQLVTTMHEEYLREYCVNKVKETLAKTRGDFKEAKEWASMAKESAEAGKLKPSQMSKADLSQGLDGFGQLSRMIEEKIDIIPLLPKFTQQPKDKVDIVLWLYINYIRSLQGLPDADYKDIYQFYEERKADYEKQELDNDPSMRIDEE